MKQSARKKLYEVSRTLANVAMGKAKADLVVKGGTLVNVYTGELLPLTDVAVAEGRIAFVGDAEHTIGEDTVVIDAAGRHIVPGLLDGHMHVESTMLSVAEFAKAALAKGTTGIFMDPHEIANVFGAEGVRWMHEEGQGLPLKVYTTFSFLRTGYRPFGGCWSLAEYGRYRRRDDLGRGRRTRRSHELPRCRVW